MLSVSTQPAGNSTTEETFVQAEHFVAAVVSRLEKDPKSVARRLWVFQDQLTANSLWALKQQALVGSCQALRGSKEYDELKGLNNGMLGSGCCQFVAGDKSKLMLWQKLEDMTTEEAQREYIRIVEDILPQWQSPPAWDDALLRTWTSDDSSDRCTQCHEAFTLLNRRHHCRRCLSLVCAVCSPYTVPLRIFMEPATQRQRVCVTCFNEIGEAVRRRSQSSSDNACESAILSSETNNGEATSEVALVSTPAIHVGTLEYLQGAYGQGSKVFRKTWQTYFFVLLVRKGSLGMFVSQAEHLAGTQPPAAVFKLSGYTLRIRSQPKRPHQFRLTHNGKGGANPKKSLHFAALSLEDMNGWIAAITKAIAAADELERAEELPKETANSEVKE